MKCSDQPPAALNRSTLMTDLQNRIFYVNDTVKYLCDLGSAYDKDKSEKILTCEANGGFGAGTPPNCSCRLLTEEKCYSDFKMFSIILYRNYLKRRKTHLY